MVWYGTVYRRFPGLLPRLYFFSFYTSSFSEYPTLLRISKVLKVCFPPLGIRWNKVLKITVSGFNNERGQISLLTEISLPKYCIFEYKILWHISRLFHAHGRSINSVSQVFLPYLTQCRCGQVRLHEILPGFSSYKKQDQIG